MGVDLGWTQRTVLLGSDASWRLSLFDRPGTFSSGDARNRGVDLSINLALGAPGQQLTGSIGSRTARDGKRDNNASLGWRRDFKDHVLQSVSVTALTDTGGLNLDSTLVVGGEKMLLTSQSEVRGAGMIVDVESDIEDIVLRADDFSGGGAALKPGRNFIPITAYQNSSVSFDFEGNAVPAATIEPARTRYHLNKGGVEYRQIRVMKTLTVLGRLVDGRGQPLKGHRVINHASRGVTEVDGFFSMEMNAGSPTLEVRQGNQLLCQFRLNEADHRSENNVLMIGDLRCTPDTLADVSLTEQKAG